MMEENRNTFTSLKHLEQFQSSEQFQSNHDQKQQEEEEEKMKCDNNSKIEEEEEEEEDVLETVDMGDDETIMNEEEEEEEMKRKSQGIWGEVEKMLVDNNLSDRRSKSLQIDEILNLLALFHDLNIHFTT